jgi:hypothetical protein
VGDRANIKIIEGDEAPIYLYIHWKGHEYPEMLRLALAAGRGRWGDPAYLNRIIAREVFADLTGETGGGIATYICDNEHPLIVVDHVEQTVRLEAAGRGEPGRRQFTFADYVALPEATWTSFEEKVPA